MKRIQMILAYAAGLVCMTGAAQAQNTDFPDWALTVKERFAEGEREALNEDFIGVRTEEGIVPGLYSVEATGVSTAPVVAAADAFLAALTPIQKIKAHYGVSADEWRKWSNVDNLIYVRQGVSLKELSPEQKEAAMGLLEASLSAKGLQTSLDIMKTDRSLSELNDDAFYLDEELYFLTIMGAPSPSEPWGWQLDGHHLVINYFVLGDQVVMTPTFMGAEPAISKSGVYEGNAVLQEEQDAGLALMRSLTPEQQAAATLEARKTRDDILAAANSDNLVLDYAGAKVSAFSEPGKQQLLDLVALYVGNISEGHAEVRMEEVNAYLEETWFAWIGGTEEDAVFYYRIHSPVVLIEFDHQKPVGTTSINTPGEVTRDHIHTVIRTPNGNDYGKDLLGQHLAAAH